MLSGHFGIAEPSLCPNHSGAEVILKLLGEGQSESWTNRPISLQTASDSMHFLGNVCQSSF
jgi:hypothetical protein